MNVVEIIDKLKKLHSDIVNEAPRTAQQVMADAILDAGMCMGALAHYSAKAFEEKIVAFQMDALTEAGFEIRPLPHSKEEQ